MKELFQQYYKMYPEYKECTDNRHFSNREAGYYVSLVFDYLQGIQTPTFLNNNKDCMNFCGQMLRQIFHWSDLSKNKGE